MPDIHAMNFPVGRQRVNTSGSSRETEATFEVKASKTCKTSYVSNDTRTVAIDRRARMVVSSYSRKFKTLDVEFAADIVGDGAWQLGTI